MSDSGTPHGDHPYGPPAGGPPSGGSPYDPPAPAPDPYGQGPSTGQGAPSPYGQNPYGQTPPAPPPPPGGFGGGGYGGGGYGGYPGGEPTPPKTDGVSIASLVTSFLCCLAPVGVILGFVGLSRTKGGQRKGRGLAIAGIVIGILMTLATGGIIAAIAIFADSVVTPGNAEAGQCVDLEESEEDGEDAQTIFMTKEDCAEEHDAEIVAVEEVDDANLADIRSAMNSYCGEVVSDEDLETLNNHQPPLDFSALIEDPADIEVGDHLVCYVSHDDGLTGSIL